MDHSYGATTTIIPAPESAHGHYSERGLAEREETEENNREKIIAYMITPVEDQARGRNRYPDFDTYPITHWGHISDLIPCDKQFCAKGISS